MNGKKAKILRKRAETKKIGTATEYQYHKKSIYEREGTKYCGTKELKKCTRKTYKQLKKGETI